MRELGPSSPKLHREAGEHVGKVGRIDFVIGVQGDAAQIVEGAAAAGVPRERTRFFATPSEATEFLAGFVQSDDLLLVKGSRSVKMEKIVEGLLGRFTAVDLPSSAGGSH
jgi:UDP-N-acetylmuramoyl-tripeptide--D-alanyl-D-alanine ligase